MSQNHTPPETYQNASTVNRSIKATKTTSTVVARQSWRLACLSHVLTGTWAVIAAITTSSNLGIVQLIESQTQSLFFELRGPVEPPPDIVILAIDEPSLSNSEQFYRTDPQRYAYLEPIQAWPWKRAAYAQVIEQLMTAGARSVAIDIVFSNPSSYGAADDEQLARVLQRYADRVTLAAEYVDLEMRQGSLMQLMQPKSLLRQEPLSIGSINFPLEPDGKVHRFASEFPKLLEQKYQEQKLAWESSELAVPSFEQAAVAAAKKTKLTKKGEYIYFYGPAGTFEQISFSHVLDPDNWNTYLQQGKYFKNKTVIIGSTAASLQDFHGAPFAKSWLYPERMSGVEIQANAIATLLADRGITQVIPNAEARGLLVLLLVAGAAVLLTRTKRTLTRFIWATGIAITWQSISYVGFIHAQLILPTAVPVMAIALSGFSYLATGAISDSLRKLNLRRTLERYASFPIVQEIISQQDDMQHLLHELELVTLGKIVGARYKIIKVLGAGGFSETYIAEDNQRPGNPLCVVKQLRPASNNPRQLQVARRLFRLEAKILEKLGTYNQIPMLFAYFEEEEEFYLVQELIVGHPLSQELQPGKPLLESVVIQILQDLLQTLEFVHSCEVIHRDIKPSNIIRRHSDSKLVLIDFGAVKEVSTQVLDQEGQTGFTIGIGTQGYAPSEQCAGRVRFSSDIYAIGMIGIKALTGLAPHELQQDAKTGEFVWTHTTEVNPQLAEVLSTMVRYDFTQRYQSALEARLALEQLLIDTNSLIIDQLSADSSPEYADNPTMPWVAVTTEIPETKSPGSPPPSQS